EQRRRADVVRVVVGIDEVVDLVADAVCGCDLVDGPLDVVPDRGRHVEQHDAVRRREERALVGAVGHPVEVPLDPADVVTLLVEGGAERGPRNRCIVRQALRACAAGVGCGVGVGHSDPPSLRTMTVLPCGAPPLPAAKTAGVSASEMRVTGGATTRPLASASATRCSNSADAGSWKLT